DRDRRQRARPAAERRGDPRHRPRALAARLGLKLQLPRRWTGAGLNPDVAFDRLSRAEGVEGCCRTIVATMRLWGDAACRPDPQTRPRRRATLRWAEGFRSAAELGSGQHAASQIRGGSLREVAM